jgi:hypothetical protein
MKKEENTSAETMNFDESGAGVAPTETNMSKFHARMKSQYPDEELDEEGLYGKASEHLDGLEKYQETNRSTNKQIAEVLMSNPELAKVINGISKGMTLREALSRFVDIEGLQAMDSDPDFDALETAKNDRMKSMKDEDDYRNQMNENIEVSKAEIQAFAEENNIDEAKLEKILDDIDSFINDIHNGKVSKAILSKLSKAFSYDTDIATATSNAKTDAMNQKIELAKASKSNATDGVPFMQSKSEPEAPYVDKSAKGGLSSAINKENNRRSILK